MEEQFIQKLTNVVDAHLDDEHFSVSELAAELGMSRTTLHRKVKQLVQKSVSAFIRETRLKRAFELLQKKEDTVAEVAYKVGFGSATYFNKCFHDFYGFPPGDVLKGNRQIHKILKSDYKKSKIRLVMYIAMSVILIVAGYIIYNQIFHKKAAELAIAVLPPEYLGQLEDTTGILEVILECIQSDLNLISGFEIVSSRTMNTYKNLDISLKKCAKKEDADYILEIKGHFSEGNEILFVKLTNALTNKTEYNNKFDFYDEKYVDIFEISENITLGIADSLDAIVATTELTQIKKRSTTNKTALSHYQNGLNFNRLRSNNRKYEYMIGALTEFQRAVQADPTYGDPYLRLANLYTGSWLVFPDLFVSGFLDLKEYNLKLDTAKIMLDNAIKYGVSDQDELQNVLANYYHAVGNIKEWEKIEKQIWRKKKGTAEYFKAMGGLYYAASDYYNAVKNWLKYLEMVPDTELTNLQVYRNLISVLGYKTGFINVALEFVDTIYVQEQNPDSRIVNRLPALGGDVKALNTYCKEQYRMKQTRNYILSAIATYLMNTDLIIGDYENAYLSCQKRDSIFNIDNKTFQPNPYVAWLYKYANREKESKMHCDAILKNGIILTSDSVHLPYESEPRVLMQLASIYSFTGQKENVYKCLERLAKRKTIPLFIILSLELLPHFDNIQNEPEFQKLLEEMKSKYQKEHNRIEKLLIKEGYNPE